MRYSGPKSTYVVQCVFAHNFVTPTFIEEQKHKPPLTKRIEGTHVEDESRFPPADKIAPEIVAAVATGDFAVTDTRLEPQVLWANMMGSSPRRGWGVVDSLLALLMWIVFPFIRRDIEKKCLGDAQKN